MNDFNIQLWVTISMLALPVGVFGLLVAIVVTDIVEGKKHKVQMKRFEELYKKCVKMHGLKFAQKLYDMCRDPWIGLDNVIAVFEHHCGIKNELSKKLQER